MQELTTQMIEMIAGGFDDKCFCTCYFPPTIDRGIVHNPKECATACIGAESYACAKTPNAPAMRKDLLYPFGLSDNVFFIMVTRT